MIAQRIAASVLAPAIDIPGFRIRMVDDRVTVLMYHDLCQDHDEIDAWASVRLSDFLRQIRVLRRDYELVSLDTAAALRSSGERPLRPLAVVTFDDGLAGNADVLLPIVEQLELPVTVYVATSHIEDGRGYWFDRVVNALQTKGPVELDLQPFGLGRHRVNDHRGARNWSAIQKILVAIKALDTATQETVAAAIEAATERVRRPDAGRLRPMTLTALRRLATNPHVTIGAHTHCHRLLTHLPLAEARASIQRSRALLREWTGQPVDHFAYPSGDFDERVVRLVESLGFRTAVTTEPGLWSHRTDPLRVPRVAVGRYDSDAVFRVNLVGGIRQLARLAWN